MLAFIKPSVNRLFDPLNSKKIPAVRLCICQNLERASLFCQICNTTYVLDQPSDYLRRDVGL
jgi:hypothetical protein